MNKNNLIYLDNNSTTRVDPRVFDAMAPYFHELYGNPSSPHRYGLEASIAVEASRSMIKKLFGIEDRELYFTSSATESINIAIMGTAFANFSIKKHLITQATEHPAVLEVFKSLESLGFRTTVLDVDGQGFVDPQAIKNAIEPIHSLFQLWLQIMKLERFKIWSVSEKYVKRWKFYSILTLHRQQEDMLLMSAKLNLT
jgi:cysteine desulfurase